MAGWRCQGLSPVPRCLRARFGVILAAGLFGIPRAVTHAGVTRLRGSGLPVAGAGLRKSSGDSWVLSPWKMAVTGLRSPWKPSVTVQQQW